MGQMLGEEVLAVGRRSPKPVRDIRLLGKDNNVTCPGRTRTNEGRGGVTGTYTDGPAVDLKLGFLTVDNVALGTVDGKVCNEIAQRLKRGRPIKTLSG